MLADCRADGNVLPPFGREDSGCSARVFAYGLAVKFGWHVSAMAARWEGGGAAGIFGAVCRCDYRRRRKPSSSIRPMENSAQEYAGR